MLKKISSSTIILLLGIALFLIGCIQPFRYESAIESGYEIDATVVELKTRDETDSESGYTSTSHTVYADYEFNGKVYKHVRIGKYYDTDNYYVGKTVKIVVDPNNHGKIMKEGGVVCTVGFLIAIIGIVLKITDKKKAKTKA